MEGTVADGSGRGLNKRFYLILYGFMMTDFYVRAIPLIMLLFVVSEQWSTFNAVLFAVALFGSIAVFEFVSNIWFRIRSHRKWTFIAKIFAVSVVSSFYSMLSVLDILSGDPLFAKSVVFCKYAMEHAIRCAVSVLIIICLVVMDEDISHCHHHHMLTVIFFVFFAVNGVSMRLIYRMIIKEDESSNMEQQLAASAKDDAVKFASVSPESAGGVTSNEREDEESEQYVDPNNIHFEESADSEQSAQTESVENAVAVEHGEGSRDLS